ncbi:MAG: cofactor-independent phosphoglycerate mutase [Desulfomonilaceae bacterium]
MSSDSDIKYLIIVPDGMADAFDDVSEPTSLESSNTPWMDKMASAGKMGISNTIPEGLEPGSDVATLSLMGYSAVDIYTGRAPFEAASMGIDLKPLDLAFRLNLVTLERNYNIMADHSGDHISSPEAKELIGALAPEIESLGFIVHPGVSYRNLLIWEDGPDGIITFPPHDFPGQPISRYLPSGCGADKLLRLIIKSWRILNMHPVNQRRLKRGQGQANSVWPWGQGKPPSVKTLQERFGLNGAVVAAVDLVRGIGRYAGLEMIDVDGATGYLDTNYEGKVRAAIDALTTMDFVLLHIEAPDEAGHSGQKDLKIKAIEDFDQRVVGPVLKELEAFENWRILLAPDHQTPVSKRIHTRGPIPFIFLDSQSWKTASDSVDTKFSERSAANSGLKELEGMNLIEVLFGHRNLQE